MDSPIIHSVVASADAFPSMSITTPVSDVTVISAASPAIPSRLLKRTVVFPSFSGVNTPSGDIVPIVSSSTV